MPTISVAVFAATFQVANVVSKNQLPVPQNISVQTGPEIAAPIVKPQVVLAESHAFNNDVLKSLSCLSKSIARNFPSFPANLRRYICGT